MDDGQQGMALLRVGVYDTEAEMGAITTEAGEIFNPVIGLARGDVKACQGDRLPVGDGGPRCNCAESCR